MLLLLPLALGVAAVPLGGGKLRRLADVRFRWFGLVALAFVVQMLIMLFVPDRSATVLRVVHVASYVPLGMFLVVNRRVPGLWLVALGGVMNFAAIAANRGIMPASVTALSVAGLTKADGGFTNSAAVADPQLSFLGDIFALPGWLPFQNVFSLGDALIVLGAVAGIHVVCGSWLVPSAPGELSALREHPTFLRLWLAHTVSNFGDWIFAVAVATSLVQQGAGAGTVAALLVAQIGPGAFMGLFGGQLADRLPRRAVMLTSDFVRCAGVASLLVVDVPTSAHLYAVAATLGVMGALFGPSLQASLPNLVRPEQLISANSLLTGSYHLAIVVGPVLGGFLAASGGLGPAVTANAASFALSGILVATVALGKAPAGAGAEREVSGRAPSGDPAARPTAGVRGAGAGALGVLFDGLRSAVGTPIFRRVVPVVALLVFAAALRAPLEPLFVLRVLSQPASALGLVGGVWGAGMLLGSLAAPAGATRWARDRLLRAALVVVGLTVIAAAFADDLRPVLALWLFAGVGNGIGTVAYESMVQQDTPDAIRGRVLAATEAVLDSAYLAGLFAVAWLEPRLGIRGTYALSGVLFLAAAALSLRLLRRKRGGLKPRTPPQPAPAPALALGGDSLGPRRAH